VTKMSSLFSKGHVLSPFQSIQAIIVECNFSANENNRNISHWTTG